MPKWTLTTYIAHNEAMRESGRRLQRERDRRYKGEAEGLASNVRLLAKEQKAKNQELNDVRSRFIPREVFENYKEEQAKKVRNGLIFMFIEAIAIIALGLSLIGLLMRGAGI